SQPAYKATNFVDRRREPEQRREPAKPAQSGMGSRFAATHYDETGRCLAPALARRPRIIEYKLHVAGPRIYSWLKSTTSPPIDTRADAADGSASGAPEISGNFHPASCLSQNAKSVVSTKDLDAGQTSYNLTCYSIFALLCGEC